MNTLTKPIIKFSKRETEVLKCLKDGMKGKTIAETLDIDQKTVSTYKARAAQKLQLTSESNDYVIVTKAIFHEII